MAVHSTRVDTSAFFASCEIIESIQKSPLRINLLSRSSFGLLWMFYPYIISLFKKFHFFHYLIDRFNALMDTFRCKVD